MIRVSTILGVFLLLAVTPLTASDSVPTDIPAQTGCEFGIGLGLDIQPTRVSLDGFFFSRDDSSRGDSLPQLCVVLPGDPGGAATRVRTVELISAPNAGDCLQRLTAAARVLTAVTRCAARAWWRNYTGTEIAEGH